MKGIQFLTDEAGAKKSVLIDLELYGELLEDFFDIVISRERLNEPAVPFEDVVAEIEAERAKVAESPKPSGEQHATTAV